jgi:hypothetical protein
MRSAGEVLIGRLSDGPVLASHPLKRHIWRVMPMAPAHVVIEAETGNRNTSELHVFEFREHD